MARDRTRPWKRGSLETQVGVPRAPRGADDDDDAGRETLPLPPPARAADTSRAFELETADLERVSPVADDTQRVAVPRELERAEAGDDTRVMRRPRRGGSEPAPEPEEVGDETELVRGLAEAGAETELVIGLQRRSSAPADPAHLLRACLARIGDAPDDPDARRALRAIAADADTREQLAALLGEEARAAARPEAAAALLEELAEVLEDLDRTVDAIAAMEHLVRLAPDEIAHHDRLARLYHQAHAWVKAAEAFEQVAALARDARARAALGAAARLYREHGRPERAVEMYRLLVARHPADLEAWRHLDELLEALGRWRELAETRAARAARAVDGVEKAVLLRAQVRALEQAEDRAAAAVVMAEAARLAPEQMSGLVDYADVLARGGRGREAAELLARRVADAVARGGERDGPGPAAARRRTSTWRRSGCATRRSSRTRAAIGRRRRRCSTSCSRRRRTTCRRSSGWSGRRRTIRTRGSTPRRCGARRPRCPPAMAGPRC